MSQPYTIDCHSIRKYSFDIRCLKTGRSSGGFEFEIDQMANQPGPQSRKSQRNELSSTWSGDAW